MRRTNDPAFKESLAVMLWDELVESGSCIVASNTDTMSSKSVNIDLWKLQTNLENQITNNNTWKMLQETFLNFSPIGYIIFIYE